jgi:hypothetical protein
MNTNHCEEDEEDEKPDYQTNLLARIRQMKAEGFEFLSSSDIPDSTDTVPQGHTMFHSTSRFGR